MTAITWQQLDEVTKQFGDSFYLLDLEKFQSNYQQFLMAFRSIYPNSQIAYSYKTNYTPRLCQLVQKMGGYAEVVSGMEYDLAIQIGVPAKDIIFNGPYKRAADFKKALINGSVVNLDSMYEVELISSLAPLYSEQMFRVGIRCNFSNEINHFSRFGFDVEQELFQKAIKILQNIENCQIVGLHCHFLPPERSAKAYEKIAQQMVALAETKFSQTKLKFLDLGGGFFSPMTVELKKQFPYPIPSFSEYGQAIANVFSNHFSEKEGPELILEPGISITADAMKFITKVIDLKLVQERTLALVSGSQYDIKPTLSSRKLPMTLYSPTKEIVEEHYFDVVGSTCMEGDFLYTGFKGSIKVNDYLIFDNVGSYTNVLRPSFINPAPPILAYSTEGEIEVIRRGETIEDVFSTYQF